MLKETFRWLCCALGIAGLIAGGYEVTTYSLHKGFTATLLIVIGLALIAAFLALGRQD